MVEISDSLRSLFTAPLEERDGRYVLEIPASEIEHEAIRASDTYRVAVLEASEPTGSSTQERSREDSQRDAPASDPSQPPVAEGEIREVTVESVGDQGDGIAKVERGYVVIVPDAEPGDEPTVEIEQVRENVAFATVIDGDSTAL